MQLFILPKVSVKTERNEDESTWKLWSVKEIFDHATDLLSNRRQLYLRVALKFQNFHNYSS